MKKSGTHRAPKQSSEISTNILRFGTAAAVVAGSLALGGHFNADAGPKEQSEKYHQKFVESIDGIWTNMAKLTKSAQKNEAEFTNQMGGSRTGRSGKEIERFSSFQSDVYNGSAHKLQEYVITLTEGGEGSPQKVANRSGFRITMFESVPGAYVDRLATSWETVDKTMVYSYEMKKTTDGEWDIRTQYVHGSGVQDEHFTTDPNAPSATNMLDNAEAGVDLVTQSVDVLRLAAEKIPVNGKFPEWIDPTIQI